MNKWLQIHKIQRKYDQDKVRVEFICKSDSVENFTLWYEFDKQYDIFLSDDRCDAAVVALIFSAIRDGFKEISSEIPMSEKLYHNLKYQIIPQLANSNRGASRIKLNIPTTPVVYQAPLVVTGMSRGVDSFATYVEYLKECDLDSFRLDAFTYFQVGAHHGTDAQYHSIESSQELYINQLEKTKEFCNKYNFKLIDVATNIDRVLNMKAIFQDKGFFATHTNRNCSVVMLLQKLISKYYYSSTYQLSNFIVSFNTDMAHYEKWLLPLLNTGSTEFYQSNQDWSRLQKVQKIAKYPECQDYLQVCLIKTGNCGHCMKCKRTLIELDSMGEDVLNSFGKSFDLDDYKQNYRKKWFSEILVEKDKPHGEAHYYDEAFVNAYYHHPEILGDLLPIKNPNISKVVLKDKVNIRDLPSLLSNILSVGSKGDTFTYLGEGGAWVGIQNEKYQKAFVKKSFVDLI